MNACRTSVWNLALLALLQLLSAAAHALEQIEINLGDVQGEGWQAQTLKLHIGLPAGADLTGDISVAALTLPAPLGTVGAVRLRCAVLQHDERGTRCRGRAEIAQVFGEAVNAAVQIEHEAASGRVHVALQELRLADGRWQFDAQMLAGHWSLTAQGRQIDSVAARELLRRFMPTFDYTLNGRMNLDAQVQGDAAGVSAVQFKLNGDTVDFANASGTQAGEKLHFELAGQGKRSGSDWQGEAQVEFASGALFVDPLYLEFAPQTVLHLSSRLRWSETPQRLYLDALSLDHAGVAQAQADVQVRWTEALAVEAIDLDLREAQLPGAYVNYIQPWLRGRLGDALETAGRFSGQYRYRADGTTALRLNLRDVDIDDSGERFGFSKLAGVIDWGSDAAPRTTELHWQGGSLYRLALGASRLAVVSRGAQFELREPAHIPVLDGLLTIDDFALSGPGDVQMPWRFSGVLSPVSMEAVSAALGWPRFGGELSGAIPAVSYANGLLEVGGELQVHAFDGDLTVRNLRLEQPFGRIPRLNADLAIDNLDLEALTQTFEFGRIEGRLSGYVKQLRMEDWQPVAFDARFATPADDASRHRISQKAVDSLSSIGGGMGGVLSRSFLGVFEDFPYECLGLSCVLENGVCRMGGVMPTENGYYIVKGRFLPPRIDVVGYADRVDWQTLIERLKSVTLDQPPEVR